MKVAVDTNVVLDVLLARKPFVVPASRVFSLIEQSKFPGVSCATVEFLSQFDRRRYVVSSSTTRLTLLPQLRGGKSLTRSFRRLSVFQQYRVVLAEFRFEKVTLLP